MAKFTVPKAQKLSVILLLLAIVYFYFQVEYGFEKAKVDENAVQAEWVKPVLVEKYMDQFGINEKTFRSKCSSTDSLKKWISKIWNQHSIENYIFNDKNYTDSSIIYGIHKSPFSDGKTSTIIALTYDIEDINYACAQPKYKQQKALSSISSFITISTALSKVNWCSKDIIFVLIQRNSFDYKHQISQLSSQRHSSYSLFESFTNTILPRYASVCVGGIIIEIPLYCSSRILSMNVAGNLGFQPNYDIVATAMVCFTRNNFILSVTPYFSTSFWNNNGVTAAALENEDNLRKSMLRSMAYEAIGKSNGYHGSLVSHRIDAMSVISMDYYTERSSTNSDSQLQINAMFNVCRSIELFTRSMSNLIEIFHHATFNYIIISQSKFITMAKYSIPIGMCGLSPLIEAVAIYTECYANVYQHLAFSVCTLFISIVFGIYTYVVLFIAKYICFDLFYMVIFAVFSVSIGSFGSFKIWYHRINEDCYASCITLLSIYAMLSQIWLPIALNFSIGLYFVVLTAVMLLVVRKRAITDNEDKTVFVQYEWKYRVLRMFVLFVALPTVAIYSIMFIMDMDLFNVLTNLKYDLLHQDIYNKHPAWIVFFLTIVPTYAECCFLLMFS